MILVKADVGDFNGIPFLNTLYALSYRGLYLLVQNLEAVFYCKLDMVVTLGNVVVPMPDFGINVSHNTNIVPQTRYRV